MRQEEMPLIVKQKTHPQQLQSCVSDAKDEALTALKERNFATFLDAINDEEFDVNADYEEKGATRKLIDIAIYNGKGQDPFVKALIQAGASTDTINPQLEEVPFHKAIIKRDPELLELCLRGAKNVNVLDGDGSTALHKATEGLIKADKVKADLLVQCIGILVSFAVNDVNVDAEDSKGEFTPLRYAALAGNEKAVRLLLSCGADVYNNVDGTTVESIIREKIPGLDPRFFNKQPKGRPLASNLRDIIELSDNLEGFQNCIKNKPSHQFDPNDSSGIYTLLQYACYKGRDKIVGFLLQRNADPTRCSVNSNPPMVLAAHNGYHKVLKAFFDNLDEKMLEKVIQVVDDAHGKRTILHEIVKPNSAKQFSPERDENSDYVKCFQVLFDSAARGKKKTKSKNALMIEAIINYKDQHGETALHYAVQQPNQDIIKVLLKHGANLSVKNNEERSPVESILPTTLNEFLDECIMKSENAITDDELILSFDYNFLAPPLLDKEAIKDPVNVPDAEKASGEIQVIQSNHAKPETEALWYMSESPDHRHLLKHPVLASFLWMKWQRIKSYYYVALVLYFIFVVLLSTLIMLEYGGCSLVPGNKSKDGDLNSSKSETSGNSSEEQNERQECRTNVTGLKLVLVGFLIELAIVELLQILVSFKRYFVSPENYIQVAILIGTVVLMFDRSIGWEGKRHLAALLIIFSWSELLIIVGQHPSLNTYVTMLYTVVTTFFKFLLWYMLFIVAFAFSFYIMFHTDFPGSEKNEDYEFFDKIGTCIVKTSAMFVGELEFSDIPFSENPISYIVFVSFIFLIVVVLMNLLNGLAVSDTGLIREAAEVLSLKSQVDLISYWESILLIDPYKFLTSWPKLLSMMPDFSCCVCLKRLPRLQTLIRNLGGKRILLFYEYLPEKQAKFKPNGNHKISTIPYRKRIKEEDDSRLELRKDILDSAKHILLGRQQNDGVPELSLLAETIENMDNKILGLEDKMDRLGASLDNLINILNTKRT